MKKLKIYHGGLGRANIQLNAGHNDGEWCCAAYSQKEVLTAIGTWGNPFRTGHATTLERYDETEYAEMLANPGVIYVRPGSNYPRPPWAVWEGSKNKVTPP